MFTETAYLMGGERRRVVPGGDESKAFELVVLKLYINGTELLAEGDEEALEGLNGSREKVLKAIEADTWGLPPLPVRASVAFRRRGFQYDCKLLGVAETS